ncbi:MAG: hypothetical protein M3R00_08295 [Pseudomonadota bacterium]|nr:hypothetical protein [Pseudomonadota bacterium]
MSWQPIIFTVLLGALAWLMYRQLKGMPADQLSKASIFKSLDVLGILAIGLVIFIWILVLLLKSG